MSKRVSILFGLFAAVLVPARADAWPSDLSRSIARDALRLLPKSLADLLKANEEQIFSDARVSQSPALTLLYADLGKGGLSPATQAALALETSQYAHSLQGKEFEAALIAMGASYRLAVDLADPAVSSALGNDPKTAAIRKEFYLFVAANREKIPLVISQPESLKLRLEALPGFLGDVTLRTMNQGAMLRAEALDSGRVFNHAEIDFRHPVFAVASTAYSRSVTAVAATWIAIWRSAGGDMNRQKQPHVIAPRLYP